MNFFVIVFILFTILVAFNNKTKVTIAMNISAASGDFPHPVVIGGYAATMVEFPYAVRVYIFLRSTLIFCTGEIVHKKLVLTAAHCVEKGGSMLVVTGNADQEDYMEGKHLDKYARYRVIDVFVHPNFSRARYMHDLAIVKLGREICHKGSKVLPISYEPLSGPVKAVIYGWGGTEENIRNHQLYAKNLSIERCWLHSKTYEYVCLIGRGICHGDSGGGVVVDGYLRGVASFFEPGSSYPIRVEERYYYVALWQEKDFLDSTIRKNGGNYNRCFLFLEIVFFIFII